MTQYSRYNLTRKDIQLLFSICIISHLSAYRWENITLCEEIDGILQILSKIFSYVKFYHQMFLNASFLVVLTHTHIIIEEYDSL